MSNLNFVNPNNFVSARGAYYGEYGIILCVTITIDPVIYFGRGKGLLIICVNDHLQY